MKLSVLLCLAAAVTANADHTDLFTALGPAHIIPRSWTESYTLASSFVAKLSRQEKIGLTTGKGLINPGGCNGNIDAIKRLSFPELCLQDGPAGVRTVGAARFQKNVTVWPAGVTAGATWDRELIYLRSRGLGKENRASGVHISLSPVAGALGRAPAAGRNWEGFGSDPYLAGKANRESVRGIQDEGVMATVKHWIGNEQEAFRLTLTGPGIIFKSLDSQIDERTLKEVYAWPFADAVEAGVVAVMCSYQRVNELYVCESVPMLRHFLKANFTRPEAGGLGFRGLVMTDWFASAGASQSASGGLDVVMPGDGGRVGSSAEEMMASDGALQSGSRLDEMATRVVAAWYKLHQDTRFTRDTFSLEIHAKLARRIAAEGTVLLKNVNAALPLKNTTGLKIGVFGNDAAPIKNGANSCGEFSACNDGTLAMGWGSGGGHYSDLVDPLRAIQAKAATIGATVTANTDDFAYAAIRRQAAAQNVCLVFVNSRSGEGTNTVEGNYGDRRNITLWRQGDALIGTVADSCQNTVVVIHSVGAVTMESWIDHPNVTAVVYAGLPGQESGNAAVDVLWGAVNPSGKLPFTVAKAAPDYCCRVKYDWNGFYPEQPFPEGLLIDYRWFDAKGITPRFEFGFGLSYTTFVYSAVPTISAPVTPIASTSFYSTIFTVTVSVTNTGSVFGKEVVQLYLAPPPTSAPAGTPVRVLRGFSKVSLQPGETRNVAMDVTKRDLSTWDTARKTWRPMLGNWEVIVGASSRSVKARGFVNVA